MLERRAREAREAPGLTREVVLEVAADNIDGLVGVNTSAVGTGTDACVSVKNTATTVGDRNDARARGGSGGHHTVEGAVVHVGVGFHVEASASFVSDVELNSRVKDVVFGVQATAIFARAVSVATRV